MGWTYQNKDTNFGFSLGPAMLNRESISFLTKNASTTILAAKELISSGEINRKPYDPRVSSDKNRETLKVYDDFAKNKVLEHLEDPAALSQTGYFSERKETSFSYENGPSYYIHQTNREMQEAIKNAADKGQVVGWDLETMGGKIHGKNPTLGRVTEFSFIRSTTEGKTLDTYHSIIGSTQEEFDEYQNIIDKYRRGTRF